MVELASPLTMLLGKHLADLGAEVVLIEDTNDHRLETYPPAIPMRDGPMSATRLSYSLGKRIVRLDLATEQGRETLRTLVSRADVFAHDMTLARAQAIGLGHEALRAANPRLIVVSVTPFGADGPFAERASSDLVQVAMSGYLHMTGNGDGRPIKPSAPAQSYLHAGNHAFGATLIALRHRKFTGRGTYIDQSARDTGTWMLTHTYQHWDMQRINLKRQGQNRDMGAKKRLRSVFPCKDGFVVWMFQTGHIGSRGITAFVKKMDSEGMAPDWLRAIDWMTTDLSSAPAELNVRLEEAFGAYLMSKTGTELLEFAIESGLMMAPARTIADVVVDPQLEARESWRTVEQPGVGTLKVPGGPVHMRDIRWEPRGPAVESSLPGWEPLPPPGDAIAAGLPLAGIRVLDFGSTLAAPTAARLLADFGADVIKVESHAHPDTLRVGTPYLGGIQGVDRSGYFAAYSAGKRSFALNLQHADAKDIVRRLVENADILVENFAPGVMGRLGLTPDVLHGWNPKLIIASHALQGQTGPRSRHRGYGQIASGMTGWYDLTGDEGGEPLGPYSAYTDFLSVPLLLSSMLIALEVRDQTGEGQHIDHAQVESSLHFLAPLLLEHQLTGRVRTRSGNHEDHLCPNNAYPAADSDEWVALSVQGDAQWQAFCAAIDAADLASDPRFATHLDRKANEVALDLALDAYTSRLPAKELDDRLQAAGIPSGKVAKASDFFVDPQFAHRNFFHRVRHPELGDHAVITPSFRIEGLAQGPFSAAPCLGEHTFDIASALLGLDGDTIGDLVARGVLQ